jgi:type I restriction enzyme S subunit
MSQLSFLDKLLDGVEIEWKPLSEVFNLKNGYTPSKSKKEYWENGTVPWFRMDDLRQNGNILSESLQKVASVAVKGGRLFPPNSIIVATSATIGEHALITVPFLANQRFTCLSLKGVFDGLLDIKFLYYYCFLLSEWCTKNTTQSSFASVEMDGFKKYPIPIPCPDNPEKSLAIQAEIVRILDSFTELTTELTSELTSELNARKKQYNYYCDQLLSFEDGEVEWKTLGDVADINTGKKPNEILEKTANFDYINAGTSRSGYCIERNCAGDTVTTPSRGQGGIGYVGYQKDSFWLGPLCYKIQSKEKDILSNKFIYYFFQSNKKLLLDLKKEGGVPAVNKMDLAKLQIPIVHIDKQKHIVRILDKFDTLTTSISQGLPREIELRQKQYEYYRDLLLSFPKINEVED